ncbi:NAD(P)/FAD-dependent oxidoreductase [Phenylobacterium sp.]|uniref:flavin-containing monooxygenase n=1 Tax=Phenylobacterium sp. TaxID=1871053 RepID=UPI0025E27368|nr:NAD(P)/FAD-dependent oxidoreductase [Phenylobacterium sp.]MBX3485796.1 NAD(P)/FAD-dependent oxidoreductase [Phenylobacterium sp.]
MSQPATKTAEAPEVAAVDQAFLRRVVEQADINALRLALYQQTRDPELAAMPVVKLVREGSPFESSVVPSEHHQAVKDKAVAFLLAGAPRAPAPSRDEAGRMMEMFAGDTLSRSHLDYGYEDLAFEGFPRAAEWTNRPPAEVLEKLQVIIIGAGFSGLLAAIQFDRLGIPWRIVERQSGIGGTWWLNDYPEARVDVTSFLYQFKFEKDYPWKSHYATQAELQEYLDHIVDKYDLRSRIFLNTKVTAARWQDGSKTWALDIETADGASGTVESNFVVSAAGLFSTPTLPDIEGIGTFQSAMFHTTAWDHGYDYAGKRVAVVGTGSTGSQLARAVAAKAKSLTIYQRSPKWLTRVGNYRHAVSPEQRWLMDNMPDYTAWFCFGLHVAGLQMDAFHDLDRDWQAKGGRINEKNDKLRANLSGFIRRKVGADETLLRELTPPYAPLSRRLVVDNDWYDTVMRENVELVPGRIERFDETGIVSADGTHRAFDLVVLAAGFDVSKYLWPVDYVGRDGARLDDLWAKDGARAHLTLYLPGFPNFIIMYGPNAGILSGSFHSWIELYTRYFCRLITDTIEAGAQSFEVTREAYEAYNAALDAKLKQKLWEEEAAAGGYYINAHGRPGVSMPWSLDEFYEMIRAPDLSEYRLR